MAANQSSCLSLSAYLYVQRGEVAVQLLGVVDVRPAADGTHHVSDVSVSHGDGEVLPEALVTHGALTGSQRLHLKQGEEEEINSCALNVELRLLFQLLQIVRLNSESEI